MWFAWVMRSSEITRPDTFWLSIVYLRRGRASSNEHLSILCPKYNLDFNNNNNNNPRDDEFELYSTEGCIASSNFARAKVSERGNNFVTKEHGVVGKMFRGNSLSPPSSNYGARSHAPRSGTDLSVPDESLEEALEERGEGCI